MMKRAARGHVGQVRGPARHLLEGVEVEVDLGLAGDREQVQHGVGRTAERHHDGAWRSPAPRGSRCRAPRCPARAGRTTASPDCAGEVLAGRVDRGGRGRAGQRQPHGLDRRGHRVGGEHAAAGALGGAGAAFSIAVSSSSSMRSRPRAPTASNTDWIVMSLPSWWPGRIEPP